MAQQREVDEVIVDRLRLGYKTTSTKAERIEAVRSMTGRGLSASWIAMFLRMTPRTIQRYRAISRLSLTQKAA
jgi:DNA-binding CsgD family transcriptional regulator